MAEELDVDAMIERFKERAHAVRNRPMPPVAGPEMKKFVTSLTAKPRQLLFRQHRLPEGPVQP